MGKTLAIRPSLAAAGTPPSPVRSGGKGLRSGRGGIEFSGELDISPSPVILVIACPC